ncbi:MAG TPA: DNA mismatch repair protein MutS [Clostridiales bacterium]|nr:DNA mismatch repair protein MutS [Clostridiales bacterium]
MAEITPMMKQYFEIKQQYPDTILMFRLGDFYEMFFDDAKLASRELELVLTGRDWGHEERAPMCGVPFHSVESYLAKLVGRGYKVAICEQTEDPALAKGLVKREVIRVITPGTVLESRMLDEGTNNYLASIRVNADNAGLCFADISTGCVKLSLFSKPNLGGKVVSALAAFNPAEILCGDASNHPAQVEEYLRVKFTGRIERVDAGLFDAAACVDLCSDAFEIQYLEQLGILQEPAASGALALMLDYCRKVQISLQKNLRTIEFSTDDSYMKLDPSARRNLELTRTLRSGEKKYSLLWALDATKTPMGRRLIRAWLEQPLVNLVKIQKRHLAVAALADDNVARGDIMRLLEKVSDLERLASRIVYGTANARELNALSDTAKVLPHIAGLLKRFDCALIHEIAGETDALEDVAQLIDASIADDPPFTLREGGLIRPGRNAELDELRDIVEHSRNYILAVQSKQQEATSIKKLKIGYNRVFGYYIEVPNSFKQEVPEHYIRKQTLANCERYITQELKEIEAKVLGAQERIVRLEFEIFDEVRKSIAQQYNRIQLTAQAVAKLDVLCSFAHTAVSNNYVCPQMTAGKQISIKDGRHPVVELANPSVPFVPNDALLNDSDCRCAIITGPNMAGKSTYMRQVALIVLMAHAGSFVPASEAEICIVDGIYTRIGASDDLSAGNSTFMVEMTEVASILENATPDSLIIFDEIGRGTSTFDGMSIAKAVIEYVADAKKLGAKTMFATHYHELTKLEQSLDGIKNYNAAVKKRGDDITFLRRIVRGGADDSYGIEVAKLAGVPAGIVNRAKVFLGELENGVEAPAGNKEKKTTTQVAQMSFAQTAALSLAEKLKGIDVNTLTPIEALGILYDAVNEAKKL